MPLVCMCVVKCGGGSLACDVEGGTGGPNMAEYVHLIQTCGHKSGRFLLGPL